MFGNEEGCSFPGKEKERFLGRRETGMSVGMSLDGEQMKVLEQGQRGGHPLEGEGNGLRQG